MAQILRPASTVEQSGDWTSNGAATLHEATNDQADGTFAETTNNPASEWFEVALDSSGTPDAGDVTVRWRASDVVSGARTLTTWVEVRQGTTVIATSQTETTAAGFTTFSYILSTAERDAITDWSDVRIRPFADTSGGGSPVQAGVSNLELETPSTPAVGTGTLSGGGELSGVGAIPPERRAILTWSAVEVPAGDTTAGGTGTLSGGGTLTGVGSAPMGGVGTLAGGGALTGVGSAAFGGAGTLSGGGALTGVGSAPMGGVGTLAGGGSLTGVGSATFGGTGTLSGGGTFSGTGSAPSVDGRRAILTWSAVEVPAGAATAEGTGTLSGGGTFSGLGNAPPVAPSGVSATTQSDTEILVAWTAPNDAALDVRIYWREQGQTDWVFVAQAPSTDGDYLDIELEPGTTYEYHLTAWDGSDESTPSSTVNATTDGATAEGVGTLSGGGVLTGVGSAAFGGAGTLSGGGALTGVGSAPMGGIGTLAGGGDFIGIGQALFLGTGLLSGGGTLSGIGEAPAPATSEGTGTLSGGGALTGLGSSPFGGAGTLSGGGSLTGVGESPAPGVGGMGTLSGGGTLTGLGVAQLQGTGTLSGGGTLLGIGDNGEEPDGPPGYAHGLGIGIGIFIGGPP